jgi:hypothetical protein
MSAATPFAAFARPSASHRQPYEIGMKFFMLTFHGLRDLKASSERLGVGMRGAEQQGHSKDADRRHFDAGHAKSPRSWFDSFNSSASADR